MWKSACLWKTRVYLGHRLDAEGIHTTTDKLIALQNILEPKSVPDLRSYMSMVNYYHKFLKNLSTVLVPLHKLLQKDMSWHWRSEEANAFVESKMLQS